MSKSIKEKKLTTKKLYFCELYIRLGNRTEAARQAGYSPKYAKQIAYELYQQPEIKKEIKKLKYELESEIDIAIRSLALTSANVSISDFTQLYNDDATPKALSELSKKQRLLIKSIGKRKDGSTYFVHKNETEHAKVLIAIWDRLKSLETRVSYDENIEENTIEAEVVKDDTERFLEMLSESKSTGT